ncbi:hypothetical protein [Pseudomonas sp. FEN]|nr:hypothetical protein [Pseudomonas sp. FEN]
MFLIFLDLCCASFPARFGVFSQECFLFSYIFIDYLGFAECCGNCFFLSLKNVSGQL